MNLLIVTDHTEHSESNSLYELAVSLLHEERAGKVWVCSKGVVENEAFFSCRSDAAIYAAPVHPDFSYDEEGTAISKRSMTISRDDFDAIIIRMPQPLDKDFLLFLRYLDHKIIINDPGGTIETSSKEFLMTVPHLCPSPLMCYSIAEAIELSHEYEIVLKPLYSSRGRGIMRLSTKHFWVGSARFRADEAVDLLSEDYFPMLSMRYLKNVLFGDKRTIVVNKNILGSALRLPPPDSWICNVAQGGHAVMSHMDEAEKRIEEELTPLLFEKGIVMYGFDTLVDDNGIRVLSEINSLSIGGMVPMEELSGKPILPVAARLIMDYLAGK